MFTKRGYMNTSIENTIQRTRQYWYIDGFNEMLTGIVFISMGCINAVSALWTLSYGSAILVGIGYPLIILLGTFGGRNWIKNLKEKITYPRTGYVKYIQLQRGSRVKRAVTAFFVAFTISIVSIVISRDLEPYWIVLGTGLIISASIGYLAVQIPLNRFFIMVIWTAAIGFWAAWLPVSIDFQMAILLGGCGLGWLTGGLFSLFQYLKDTLPVNSDMDKE
jgi:hypothetical protein